MTLVIHCSCGAHLEVDEKFAGQTIQCPDCRISIQAPLLEQKPARTSALALASLMLALAGAFTVIGTILAVLFGILGLRAIARNRSALAGNGYALAGIVLGVLLTAVSLFAYLRVELFGLDRILREPQWAGKLDYEGPLQVSTQTFTMTRPNKNWGVLSRSGPNDNQFGQAAAPVDSLILVNVRDDAHAIAFSFDKAQLEDKADVYRDNAVQKFLASELIRLLTHQRDSESLPPHKVVSSQNLPGDAGRRPQELVLDVHVAKHERTFILRIIPRADELFVVAAGARKVRFTGLEAQLRQIVTEFKLTQNGF